MWPHWGLKSVSIEGVKKLVRRFKRLPDYRLWKCIAKFAYYTLLSVSSYTAKDMCMCTHHKIPLRKDV